MATLAFGLLGAAFAPAGWAAAGFLAGQMFGGAIENELAKPTVVEGPRLGDLKVTTSSYGSSIPEVFGEFRLSGNVIWATDVLRTEHKRVDRVGGLFGTKFGAKKVETRWETLSVSMAIEICAGPIASVRKIWADGKLVYNLADDADAATVYGSIINATAVRFYTGTEDQLPDPLIEAHEGAGNVPAHRGTALIVLENFELEQVGNHFPSFTFEVLTAAEETWETKARLLFADISATYSGSGTWTGGASWNTGYLYPGGEHREYYLGEDGFWYASKSVLGTAISTLEKTQNSINLAYVDNHIMCGDVKSAEFANILHSGVMGNGDVYYCNWDRGINYKIYEPGTRCYSFTQFGDIAYVYAYEFGTGDHYVDFLRVDDTPTPERILTVAGPVYVKATEKYLWVYHAGPPKTLEKRAHGVGGALLKTYSLTALGYVSDNPLGIHVLNEDTDHVLIDGRPDIYELFGDADQMIKHAGVGAPHRTSLEIYSAYGGGALITPDRLYSIFGSIEHEDYWVCRVVKDTGSAYALGALVGEICEQVGLSLTTDVDTGGLTGTVKGYAVTAQMSARSALEQLKVAYQFDPFESGGKLKFRHRGQASIATIPESDLGARLDGSGPAALIELTRVQESELPLSVTIRHIDPALDYQTGAQSATRQSGYATSAQTYDLPLVMSATAAKQLAEALLFSAWQERTKARFPTTWKYAHLEPSDVVTLQAGGAEHEVRIGSREDGDGLMHWEGVLQEASTYTQTAEGGSGLATPPATVDFGGPSRLEALDIPLLVDSDESLSFYLAAAGYVAAWRGCVVFRSLDGTSFNRLTDIANDAVIGTAIEAMPAATSVTQFDAPSNSVQVRLLPGQTLASATRGDVLNGANTALLGSEVFQFQTAELITTDGGPTYKLSGFLRGRRGTDWAATGHAIGDRFVFMNREELAQILSSDSELDTEETLQPVTFGQPQYDAPLYRFTLTGVTKKPYAPVDARGAKDATGNWSVNWKRRTRVGGELTNNSDVPLSEDSESYDVVIYADGTFANVKRTYSDLATAVCAYPSADQVTDFGGAQATIHFGIFQKSATVGRGYELRKTL